MEMREIGTVKWFNDAKGYGFIEREDEGKDIFVHFSQINSQGFRSLVQGQRVEYSMVKGERGWQAQSVIIL